MCQTAAARYLVAVATCAILTLTGSFSAGQAPDAGKRVALLVGVNKYDKRNFRDLEYAERDVEELAKVLESAGYEVHLLTGSVKGDKRATLENVGKAVEAVLKSRTKKDLVLVALAGHGLQIEEKGADGKLQAESFFCPADVESGNSKTMLSIGRLFDEINRRGGGHNLVLVDACREDPTRGRGMDGSTVKTLPEGVAVLFGCRAGQKTFETKNAGGGHGVFFHYVLEGLRGEAKNDSGQVTWDRLVEFVREHVDEGVAQLIGDKSIVQTPNLIANLPGRSPVLLKIRPPSLVPGQEKSWTGENVLPTKRSKDIPFRDKVDGKDVSYRYSGHWPLKVRAENNGQIRIHDGYHEGWVTKSDFVPVKDAPAYFDRRIQAVPTDAWAWNMRGNGWSEKKQFDKAIQDLDEAIRLDPSEPAYFNNRGFAYVNKKDPDKAITDLDEAIRLDPDHAVAYSNRGSAWNLKKEPDKAIRDCDEAIRLRPNFTWPRRHKGEALMLKKDYDAALKEFDDVLRLDPKYAVVYYDRAGCLAQKGQRDAALESLQRGLQYGYRNFERMQKDHALDSIRSDPAYQKLLKQYAK